MPAGPSRFEEVSAGEGLRLEYYYHCYSLLLCIFVFSSLHLVAGSRRFEEGQAWGGNIIVFILLLFSRHLVSISDAAKQASRFEQGQASGSNVIIIFCLLLFSRHLHYILMPPSRL